MKIHYENNAPFLTISSITRTIEVSHWGNIAVEETIDLRHTGAYLKGPFSRYDYQRQSDSGISSIKSFKVGSANCFLPSLHYSLFSERIDFIRPVGAPLKKKYFQFPLLTDDPPCFCARRVLPGRDWEHLHLSPAGPGRLCWGRSPPPFPPIWRVEDALHHRIQSA